MSDKDDVFAHFDRLKDKKRAHDEKNEASAARAAEVRKEEEDQLEILNKRHHDILNNVVIARLYVIKEKLKDDITLQITPHVAEKPYEHGTGITVLFKEVTDDHFTGRKTALYYFKIKIDGQVEVEKNTGSSRNSDLTKQIGKTTANKINNDYVDNFVKIITTEWFDAVRLGL